MKGFRHSARSRLARATSLCALGAALIAAGPAAPALAADAPAPTSTVVAPVPPPLPKITKLEPPVVSPIGDDLVFIIGEQLQSVTGVTVDGVPAEFFDEGDGSLSFYTPARSLGVAQVRVTSPAGTSLDNGAADDLIYFAGEGPRLDSISPASGPAGGGATFTIRGDLPFVMAVYLFPQNSSADPIIGKFQVVSDQEIRVEAPALPGRYLVEVVNAGGPSFGGNTLYYTAVAPPTITKLSERFVFPIGDDLVFISGEHLDSVTSVTVDGVPAEFFDEGDGTLSFYTPAHPEGVAQVRVTGPGGTSADNGEVDDLEYSYPVEMPILRSVSPASGPAVGGTVTIRGDLPRILGVVFEGDDNNRYLVREDGIEVISNSEIRVKAPTMTPGRYELLVIGQGGTNSPSLRFYYTAVAAPELTQVSPAWGVAGVGGLTVITGKNLAGTKSVRFGNKLALRFVVMGNRILAMAPPQPRGVYPVTVTTAGGTSAQTSAGRYVYLSLGAG